MDLFHYIRLPFGWLVNWFYSLTNNYLLSVIFFSVILKLVLFPFSIKQQKNSQKQAALRPKENVIRKKYAGRTDRATQMKMNTEIQEMYQKENFSPFGGCLPMLLQMLVLLAVYSILRMPLTYTAGLNREISEDVQTAVVAMALDEEVAAEESKEESRQYAGVFKEVILLKDDLEEVVKDYKKDGIDAVMNNDKNQFGNFSEINSVIFIRQDEKNFVETYNRLFEDDEDAAPVEKVIDSFPDFEVFKGFNLGIAPSAAMESKELGTKFLLIIPVLNLVVSYFGQALTRKFTYQPEQSAEMKSQMRMMNIFMPLFSLFIAFTMPAAVGVYWVMSSVLTPVQQIVLSKMFPIKEITPEEMREAERLYGGKQKKKKGNTAPTTGKKKSLVYDDDDEYESISTVPDKTVLKEKKDSSDQNTVVERAPLKDDK